MSLFVNKEKIKDIQTEKIKLKCPFCNLETDTILFVEAFSNDREYDRAILLGCPECKKILGGSYKC